MRKSNLQKNHSSLLDKVKHLLGYRHTEDVSLESLLENTMHYYENIIECMPGNVYWLDKNGMTLGCNQNVLDMFGLKSLSEFKGLSFKDMAKIGNWTDETAKSFEKDTLEVIHTGISRLNVEEPPIPNSNGKLIYFLTHRVPLFDKQKNVVGIVGISIDITPRKQMEIEINRAKEAAEAANHAKTEFIANMSHDIRTPLTGVIGISEILENLEANRELKQYAKDIHQCGDQLLNMLNSILDVVSADHVNENDIITETFDLNECITDLAEIEKPTILTKNLKLLIKYDKKIPLFIINDRTKIHRILLNLISVRYDF